MRAVVGQPFNGCDLLADSGGRRKLACFRWLAVDMDRAGAAPRYTASVFGAGQSDIIAQDPEQRGLRFDVHRLGLAVDVQGKLHDWVPLVGGAGLRPSASLEGYRGPFQTASVIRLHNTSDA